MRYGWKWGVAVVGVSLASFVLALLGAGWTWDDFLLR